MKWANDELCKRLNTTAPPMREIFPKFLKALEISSLDPSDANTQAQVISMKSFYSDKAPNFYGKDLPHYKSAQTSYEEALENESSYPRETEGPRLSFYQ